MATIDKRVAADGTVSWRVRIRPKGHPLVSASFRTLGGDDGARAWARKTEDAIREGRYFGSGEHRRRTVHELLERYRLEDLPHLAASTRARLEPRLAWWDQEIGQLLVIDVTPAEVTRRLRALEARGKSGERPPQATESARRSRGATVNRYQAALRRVWAVAIAEWEWARENPAGGPRSGGRKNVKQRRENRPVPRYLSLEERSRLLEACRASACRELYPLVLLALTTGGRRSEILALRRRNVDLHRRRVVYEQTKNCDARSARLPTVTLEALQEHLRVRSIDDDRLFPGFPDGPWRSARRRAHLDAPFRFHDLRHTFASHLAMRGASVRQLQEALGHRTLAMVSRYSHLTEGHSDHLVEQIADGI